MLTGLQIDKFAFFIKCILALAFLPLNEIEKASGMLLRNDDFPFEVIPIIRYVHRYKI